MSRVVPVGVTSEHERAIPLTRRTSTALPGDAGNTQAEKNRVAPPGPALEPSVGRPKLQLVAEPSERQ